jgi:hypothetical protein
VGSIPTGTTRNKRNQNRYPDGWRFLFYSLVD